KILGKLGYRSRAQWFRPYKSSGMKLIEIAESVIQSWPDDREPVLNMMFHSNEIIPAASPYCQTWQEVEQYLNSLDEVFAYLCRNYEICSIGLGEYASFFK